MESAYVYILYSCRIDRFYTGSTVLSPGERLERHLEEYYEGAWTRLSNDWKLFWKLECECKRQALKIEKHIKNMHSRTYINNLLRFPEIGLRLLGKYS
jgi:putative endonuclease